MVNRKTLIVFCSIVIVLSLSIYFLPRSTPEQNVQTSEFESIYLVQLPYQLEYQISFQSSGWSVLNPLVSDDAGKIPFDINFSGSLSKTISQSKPGLRQIQYSIKLEDFHLSWNNEVLEATPYMSELELGFLAEIQDDGSLVATFHHQKQSEISRNIWLDIFQHSGFHVPKKEQASRELDDRFGSYEAVYQRTDQAGLILLSLTQVRHAAENNTSLSSQVTIRPNVKVSGQSRYELDATLLTPINSTVKLTYSQSFESFEFAEIDFRYSAALQKRGQVDQSSLASFQQARIDGIWESQQDSINQRRQQMLRKTVGEHDASSLLYELSKLDWQSEDPLTNELYLQIKSILELDEKALEEFLAYVKGSSASDPIFRLIVDLLGAVGTESCQRALVELIESRHEDTAALYYAIPSLALLDHPIVAVERKLKDVLIFDQREDIRSTSLLALGSVGLSVRSARQDSHQEIFQLLSQKLAESTKVSEQSLLLASLGNLGHEQQIQVVSSYLAKQSNPSVKADAIRSLRFHPGPESSQLLLEIAQQEDEADLVYHAMYSLRFKKHSEPLLQQLIDFYPKNQDSRVREQIIQILLNHRDIGFVEQTLQTWKAQDSVKEIRDLLRMAL